MNDTHEPNDKPDPLPASGKAPSAKAIALARKRAIAAARKKYMQARQKMGKTRKHYESAQILLGKAAQAYYNLVPLPAMEEIKRPVPLAERVPWYALDNLIALPIITVFAVGLGTVGYGIWHGLLWLTALAL